jgi:hypothetical protein
MLHYVFIEPQTGMGRLHTGMGMDKLIHGVGTILRYILMLMLLKIPQV